MQNPYAPPKSHSASSDFARGQIFLLLFRASWDYFVAFTAFSASPVLGIHADRFLYDVTWVVAGILELFAIGYLYHYSRSRLLIANFVVRILFDIAHLAFILKIYHRPVPAYLYAVLSVFWFLFVIRLQIPEKVRRIVLYSYAAMILIMIAAGAGRMLYPRSIHLIFVLNGVGFFSNLVGAIWFLTFNAPAFYKTEAETAPN